ncbi:hypothetical protein [Acidocella sp.]|uniref:hypothetical protein n=1 Tax=Acidocella sp. TaxID=50710 RepID=UPI002601E135|nr:hypothetical protein [Acidocella sp.]
MNVSRWLRGAALAAGLMGGMVFPAFAQGGHGPGGPGPGEWHGGGPGNWHGGNWHGGGPGGWHGGPPPGHWDHDNDWHGHGWWDGDRHWHWFAGWGPAYGYVGPAPVWVPGAPVYYGAPPPPPPVYYAPPPPPPPPVYVAPPLPPPVMIAPPVPYIMVTPGGVGIVP